MHRTIALLIYINFVFFSQAAHAEHEELKGMLNRNNCSACHMIDKHQYGPILQEVAAKYKGDAGAGARLAAKIKSGGSGVWGEDMMPPQPHVSDADAKKIAEMILKLETK